MKPLRLPLAVAWVKSNFLIGLAHGNDQRSQSCSNSTCKLLQGIKDRVRIGLLFQRELFLSVGHDIAEGKPHTGHEDHVKDENQAICQLQSQEGEEKIGQKYQS